MPSISGPIRLGIIGAGGNAIGNSRELAFFDGVDVVAISEPSPENRDRFKEHLGLTDVAEYDAPNGYETMLAECNLTAVGIFSPHSLHFPQAMAALKAGVHVFCEKPMANGVDGAVEMVEYAEAHDLVIALGYQRHFEPIYATGRQVIEEGLIGDVKGFNVFMAQGWDQETTWRGNPKFSGGGQINDSGSHLQDILLWMTQMNVSRVTGNVDFLRKGKKVAVEVNCYVTIEADNGARGTVTIEGDHQGDFTERINIEGTRGTLRFRAERLYLFKDGETEELPLRTMGGDYPSGKQDNFIGNLRGTHSRNYASGRDGVRTALLTDMILSLGTGGETVRDAFIADKGLIVDQVTRTT